MTRNPQSISREMRCPCVLEELLINDVNDTGEFRDCDHCGASYVNDHGKWRSTLTLGPREKRRLHALYGLRRSHP